MESNRSYFIRCREISTGRTRDRIERIPGINVGLIVLRLPLFLLTAPSNRRMFLGSEFNRYSDEKFCEENS